MEPNTPHSSSYGDFYGYPSCCISSFHKVLRGETSLNTLQLKAGQGTGFIPCLKHAKLVEAGNVKLEDLILPTRRCESKFPAGHQFKVKVRSVDLNRSHQDYCRENGYS